MALNKRDLLDVGLRLIGVWLLTNIFQFAMIAAQMMSMLTYAAEGKLPVAIGVAGQLGIIGAVAAAGMLLILGGSRIAGLLLPGEAGDPALPSRPPPELMTAALATMGVWLVVSRLPTLLSFVAYELQYRLTRDSPDQPAWLQSNRFPLNAVLLIVIGVALFLGSQGLANLWKRLQVARYVRKEPDPAVGP